MVARARSQVERCLQILLIQDDLIVGAAVHVGIWQPCGFRGINESVGVVGNLVSRGLGATRLLDDWVLIRVLRWVIVHQGAQGCRTVSCLFIPIMVGVQARAHERLQNLVGGGVGPLLARQCEHPRDKCSRI